MVTGNCHYLQDQEMSVPAHVHLLSNMLPVLSLFNPIDGRGRYIKMLGQLSMCLGAFPNLQDLSVCQFGVCIRATFLSLLQAKRISMLVVLRRSNILKIGQPVVE